LDAGSLSVSGVWAAGNVFAFFSLVIRRRKRTMRLIVFALLLIGSLPVKADSVTYSFFGSAWLQGTNFTYVSPGGFLTFDTGPLTPTTATDVFFYDVNGPFFKNDIDSLATFDFVSEDELRLHTTTGCDLDFTIKSGFSAVDSHCHTDTLVGGSSIPASGYLLDVFTNFDVVGTGGIGIRPTDTGGGTGGGGSAPEPSSAVLFLSALALVMLSRRS
jgi:hypothetical protein